MSWKLICQKGCVPLCLLSSLAAKRHTYERESEFFHAYYYKWTTDKNKMIKKKMMYDMALLMDCFLILRHVKAMSHFCTVALCDIWSYALSLLSVSISVYEWSFRDGLIIGKPLFSSSRLFLIWGWLHASA